MVRWLAALSALLLCLTTGVAAQDWEVTTLLGLSHSLQFDETPGGLVLGLGIMRPWHGLRVGVTGEYVDFGSRHSVENSYTTLPFPQPAVRIHDDARDAWHISALVEWPLVEAASGTGSLGYYRLNGLSAFEIRDSTGQGVLRPRDVSEGSSSGPGVAVGILARIWEPIPGLTLGLGAKSHFALLHNSGDEGGFSFFHFFSGGLRVTVGL